MADIYEGAPDARQSSESMLPPSRFRPRYRQLSTAELEFHDTLKTKYAELEQEILKLSGGRYQALALTALEESCFWAVKQLTA